MPMILIYIRAIMVCTFRKQTIYYKINNISTILLIWEEVLLQCENNVKER